MLPDFDWPTIVEAQRRELDFLETLADGGPITVNAIPWREAFARLNGIVNNPIPQNWLPPVNESHIPSRAGSRD